MADQPLRPLDLHATRLLCVLLGELPCWACRGWRQGFGLVVWVDRQAEQYLAAMHRIPDEDAEVEPTETASVDLFRLMQMIKSLGMCLERLHYADPEGTIDLRIRDRRSGWSFSLYILLSADGSGLPEEVVEGKQTLSLPEEITDCENGLVSARKHLERFRKALQEPEPVPLRVGEILGLELQRFGLPAYVLTRPAMLGLVLAAVGYRYDPELTAALTSEGRGELVLWAVEQWGRLRCRKKNRPAAPLPPPPERWQRYLQKLGT